MYFRCTYTILYAVRLEWHVKSLSYTSRGREFLEILDDPPDNYIIYIFF